MRQHRKFGFGKRSPDDNHNQSDQHSPSESRSPPLSPPQPRTDPGSFIGLHQVSSQSQSKSSNSASSDVLTLHSKGSESKVNNESGPLGLQVIYTPNNGHKADIVFVHGLGGTSRWSWSKDKKPELFWPLTFLPLEPDLCLTRVLTFGYTASILRAGGLSSSVYDFAKDLLFELKYAKDAQMEDLNMGDVPLIFVVHSMGGLIVKEAYMQGQNDPEYESIIKSISAIAFLATPHRGTNLAQTLNRILDSTLISSAKQYIADLGKNSPTLQKLNKQFRHIAPKLQIVSFYETKPTSIGLKGARVMILERDSSILGYPGEISKALDADHHDVCKFGSPDDYNYITIRNVLKSIVSKIIATKSKGNPDRQLKDLRKQLSIAQLPDADYIFFRDQWTQGTNDWILQHQEFVQWRDDPSPAHSRLWLNGGAATGKSVMSSFIINCLVEDGAWCQYFFIRFGDQKKRTLGLLLRSLAYQLAQAIPGFQQKVSKLVDESIDFETVDPRITWDRIFKTILFNTPLQQPLYWVIDGLDEADNPRAILRMLSDIPSTMPIRLLFTGRRTSEVLSTIDKIPPASVFRDISIEGHLEDIRSHVHQELSIPGSLIFQEDVARRIVERSQNNFLWVRLAVEKVNQCYTRSDVENALQEFPVGMEALYSRMASIIADGSSPNDRMIALRILQCVSSSLRVLKVTELSYALGEDTADLLDFQRSIVDLCGGFVVVDNSGHVAMIHQTSRDYLFNPRDDGSPLQIDPQVAHKEMFLSCMRCIMSPNLRAKLVRKQEPEFLAYAVISWSSHLALAFRDDPQITATLRSFLTGNAVLTWIYALATCGQLRSLIQASRDLAVFSGSSSDSTRHHHFFSDEKVYDFNSHDIFKSWTFDFLRIVPKFGNILRRSPQSIFKTIPPFCPKGSAIYQLAGKGEAQKLSVTGLVADTWDDSLARMSLPVGRGTFSSSIFASGSHIALLSTSGSIFLFDSSEFEQIPSSPIRHGERIYRVELNNTGTLLATYGYRALRIWEISTGKCLQSVPSIESRTRPLEMHFSADNTTLIVGTDDKCVWSLELDSTNPSWVLIADLDEPEIEGHMKNSASHMALSRDGTLAAVAYRSHPLSAWELNGPTHLGHCWRRDETVAIRELRDLFWHPHTMQLLSLNLEGIVFKWSPYDGDIEEIPTEATKMTMSRDGDLIATGDRHGRVKVFVTETMSLLYQMVAQDTIFGLAFSPDMRRLYDIRGYYANAWAPAALITFAGHSGRDMDFNEYENDRSSIATRVPTSNAGRVDSITALAGSPRGVHICSGTDKGLVRLHDARREKQTIVFVSRAYFGIEHMVWNNDGMQFCFSDTSKQVFVFSVRTDTDSTEPKVELVAEIKTSAVTKGPILQLLFKPDSTKLLISTTSTLCTVSLSTSSVENIQDLDEHEATWIIHPQNPLFIAGFSANAIQVYDWELVQQAKYHFNWPESNDEQSEEPVGSNRLQVDRVLVARDQAHILLQVSRGQQLQNKRFYYCNMVPPTGPAPAKHHKQGSAELETLSLTDIKPASVAPDQTSNIALALAFLSRDHLVFLSKAFTVCSVQLMWRSSPPPPPRPLALPLQYASSRGPLNRQSSTQVGSEGKGEVFSLPGDWISQDALRLSSIWPSEKAFLCPRNGEVAVVKSAVLS